MPHQRSRHLLPILEKRLALFPAVGIVGARQSGKSTLLNDLLGGRRKISYVTFDREEARERAGRQPSLFLQNLEVEGAKTICLDEIQKVPKLFDALKAEIDEDRRPGRFALSGSTEFSKKTGIRESLTGRIVLLRLYPLTLAEITGASRGTALLKPEFKGAARTSKIPLPIVQKWLDQGGMPGIFGVRDRNGRHALFESWIDVTCSKDLAQFNITRFNPELGARILREIARLPIPNRTEIARSLGKSPRQIEAYLEGFKKLFVLYEIEPHASGTGKSYFFLFDSGFAESLGATTARRIQTWFLNECYSQYSAAGLPRPDVFHYVTTRGSVVDFVVESRESRYAVKLVEEEAPSTYLLRSVEAFRKKHPNVPTFVVAPCNGVQIVAPGIAIVPWGEIGK